MEKDSFIANILQYISLTPEEEQYILAHVTTRKFARGAFINKEGEVNRYTNFITKGSVRAYFIDPNGHEHVVQLGIRNWWISDYTSFITQKPGLLYCEALEPTETYSISYENLQLLYEKVPALERFYRLLIQKAYASFHNRVLHSLSMDAEERYRRFRENYPEMDMQLSQKHIASYLGMSAEFLSKIKKRLMIKEKNLRKQV
jgi:CRP-like cAMP-binding protein